MDGELPYQRLLPDVSAWDALRRPLWLFDPQELKGVYANAAALPLWGADSLRELLSRDFSGLSPAVRARTRRLADETAKGEVIEEQWTFYPRGQPLTVRAAISTFRLLDGRGVLMFEAAPAEVEAAERRSIEALRHASTAISLFDADGRNLFSNPAAFAAYGATDYGFERRFLEPERAQPMLAQALEGVAAEALCQTVTAEGLRWRHLDARAARDPVTGSASVLLIETDVTDRVEAEQALAAAERRIGMAQARQAFLTEMSHELRTPLNSVVGFSAILADQMRGRPEAVNIDRIRRAGARLTEVVERMLALSDIEPEAQAVADEPIETTQGPTGAQRVLYVDDNDNNRDLVRQILATQGIECATAIDGAQGVDAARDGPWDLILMDIQMPVMDGVQATRAIRSMSGPAGAVPILALTANTLPEQVDAYRAAGMNDCIAKPIDMIDLITRVRAWMPGAEDRCERAA